MNELESARQQILRGTQSLHDSLDLGARAKALVWRRPMVTAAVTMAAGVVAVRLLPALLWRGKASMLSRFTGELVKGAAGFALPFLLNRFSGSRREVPPELPPRGRLSNHPN